MAKLTETQRRCLARIYAGGGSCVLEAINGARAICNGERLQYLPSTYLFLIGTGHLEFREARRLGLTLGGELAALEELKLRPVEVSMKW